LQHGAFVQSSHSAVRAERAATVAFEPVTYLASNRAERLISASRLALAIFALSASGLDPVVRSLTTVRAVILPVYFIFSAALAAASFAAAPSAAGRAWTHVIDCAVVAALVAFTGTIGSSLFLLFYVYLIICATVRWRWQGALVTGALMLLIMLLAHRHLTGPVTLDHVAVRASSMGVLALLLAGMGRHQQQLTNELFTMASWPPQDMHDERSLVEELLRRTAVLLKAPAATLVWARIGVSGYRLARFDAASGNVEWTSAPDGRLHEPAATEYLTNDALRQHVTVVGIIDGAVKRSRDFPLDAELVALLRPRTILCWVVEGHDWTGQLMALDKHRPTLDDLALGRANARQARSRLDDHYLLEAGRHAAAVGERLRIRRDLHDSVVQALSAFAMQLSSAQIAVSTHPGEVEGKLRQLADHVAAEHQALRSYIATLEPQPEPTAEAPVDLAVRLEQLRVRIHDHWALNVALTVEPTPLFVAGSLAQQIYWLAHEALVNVARHARASQAAIQVSVNERDLDIVIADDGQGMPFHGLYDAGDLARMVAGPRSIRERIALLAGALVLNSTPHGTTLRIRLALPRLP
jgi:signal transduction histidine kinase